jgi:hypothetical protein
MKQRYFKQALIVIIATFASANSRGITRINEDNFQLCVHAKESSRLQFTHAAHEMGGDIPVLPDDSFLRWATNDQGAHIKVWNELEKMLRSTAADAIQAKDLDRPDGDDNTLDPLQIRNLKHAIAAHGAIISQDPSSACIQIKVGLDLDAPIEEFNAKADKLVEYLGNIRKADADPAASPTNTQSVVTVTAAPAENK